MKLEIFDKLGTGKTGLALELNLVEDQDGVFRGAYKELVCENVELIGVKS